jgi:hypothetical protein
MRAWPVHVALCCNLKRGERHNTELFNMKYKVGKKTRRTTDLNHVPVSVEVCRTKNVLGAVFSKARVKQLIAHEQQSPFCLKLQRVTVLFAWQFEVLNSSVFYSLCVSRAFVYIHMYDCGLLACDAVWFCGLLPTLRWNMLSPSSAAGTSARPHDITTQKTVWAYLAQRECLHSDQHVGLLFLSLNIPTACAALLPVRVLAPWMRPEM